MLNSPQGRLPNDGRSVLQVARRCVYSDGSDPVLASPQTGVTDVVLNPPTGALVCWIYSSAEGKIGDAEDFSSGSSIVPVTEWVAIPCVAGESIYVQLDSEGDLNFRFETIN